MIEHYNFNLKDIWIIYYNFTRFYYKIIFIIRLRFDIKIWNITKYQHNILSTISKITRKAHEIDQNWEKRTK